MGSRKIAVVGAGVSGLSTALKIQQAFKNVAVTVITEDISPNTTGDVSAGLWMPYLLQDTPKEHVNKWSKSTYDFATKLWKNGQAEETGISLSPVYWLDTNPDADIPTWLDLTLGYSRLSDTYLKKISKQHEKAYTIGYMFTTFMLEPSKLLPFLTKQFEQGGGRIEMRKVDNLDALFDEGYEIVVNCSGLSSGALASDKMVMPVRGQITRAKAQWQYHSILDESDDGNYIIVNTHALILGGTHQEGDSNLKVDEADRKFITNGCYKMAPSLKNAQILRHQVGLRPGRFCVRLEPEQRKSKKWIVHNYGHCGSGVTLSQGCADDVVNIVRTLLRIYNVKSKL